MSSFAGLNTALTALRAQRQGLNVTGQNIANANTEGYSRQRVVLESVGAPAVPAIHSTYEGAGTGVTVTDVERIRDAFLEARGRTEHGRQAFLMERSSALARVEDTIGEPSDTGLQAQLSELWTGFHDVANRPGDLAARSQLLQRAGTLTDTLRHTHGALSTQWSATRDQLSAVTDEVNTTAATVAELNEAIRRSSQAGVPANELSDRRDLLVMQLADLVGAEARPKDDGVLDVYVGGTALVRGADTTALRLIGGDELGEASATPVRLAWGGDSVPATIGSGKVAAHLDVLNSVLPGYAGRLDDFAADLAGQVNGVHASGYALDGSQPGDFFTGTTAATIRAAVTEPSDVAASRYGGGAIDGGIATAIGRLAELTASPDANYRQVVVDLGVEAQTANRRAQIQADVTTQVDSARDAQAGVDLDEEMVNMLTYQRAYEGAARVMTSIDQALDKLINSTGIVGR